MKKRVLAVLLALALAAALLPVAALADDPTLQSQIDSASSGAIITLDKDYTESITISEGKTITLNLNNHKIVDSDSALNSGASGREHTITVEKGAILIIEGTGTVDNVSHGKGAIFNNGK